MYTYLESTLPEVLNTDGHGKNEIAAILRSYARYVTGDVPRVVHQTMYPWGWRQNAQRDDCLRLDGQGSYLGAYTLLNPVRRQFGTDSIPVAFVHNGQVRLGRTIGGSRERGRSIMVDSPDFPRVSTGLWVWASEEAESLLSEAERTRRQCIVTRPYVGVHSVERQYTGEDFKVDALALTYEVPARSDLNGKIVTITRVDSTFDRFYFKEDGVERFCSFNGAHIVKRADGTVVSGTPVRVVSALDSASDRFKAAVSGRAAFVVESPRSTSALPRVQAWLDLQNRFVESFRLNDQFTAKEVEFLLDPAVPGQEVAEEMVARPIGWTPDKVDAPGGHTVDGLTAAQWKDKWDRLWKALGEQANDRDWCSEYDDFARANGGPERPVNHDVRVEAITEWEPDEADTNLQSVLNTHRIRPDVSETVSIVHQFWLNDLPGFTGRGLEDQDSETLERLTEVAREKGWNISHVNAVAEWNES